MKRGFLLGIAALSLLAGTFAAQNLEASKFYNSICGEGTRWR
jgi:hypothetical protein